MRRRPPAVPALVALTVLALAAFAPVGSAFATFTKQASVASNTLGSATSFPVCYRDAVLADTPVSYWRMDETSGIVAADSKGSNPGTYVNGPALGQTGALPDAVNNRAPSFDGVDDRVEVPASASLNATSQITIEGWIYPTDTASTHPIVEYGDANVLGVHLWTYDTGTKLYANLIDTTGASHVVMSAPVFTTNTWYHVGLTYNGSAAVLYVNGTEVARTNVGAFSLKTNLPVNIGRRPAGSQQGTVFAGKLDEFAIYSTALTATKIRSHYTTGRCYKDAVLADNPVGYWRLGETAGTTAVDGVRGRHGVYTNGPTLNQAGALNGDANPATRFDGVDDRVVVPLETALNPSQFTVEAWARPTGGAGTIRNVAASFYDSGGPNVRGYFLGADNSDKWVMYLGTGTTYAWVSAQSVVLNTWTHVVGSFDGTTARLYVDGVLVDTKAVTYSPNTVQPFTMGGWPYLGGWGDQFAGQIDEVALYGTVLPATRIQAHYLVGRSYQDTVLDSGPVSYWRLGEASGSSAADSKGTNTGTYTNAPGLAQPGALAAEADTAAMFTSGSSTYVDVPYTAALNPAQFTVEAWTKWGGGGSGAWRTVAGTWNDSTGGGYWLGISTGGYWYVSTQASSGSYSDIYGPTATTGTWVHLAATRDATALRLYVNGVEVANTPSPNYLPQTSFPLYIGANRYPGGPGDYFDGVIDDVAVYNRALTAAEVQLHYDSGRQ